MGNLVEEINLFKKINGENKVIPTEHQNFISGNSNRDAVYNQGIGRAKLRKFIIDENINIDYWENIKNE